LNLELRAPARLGPFAADSASSRHAQNAVGRAHASQI
jgi:hypothetical protein